MSNEVDVDVSDVQENGSPDINVLHGRVEVYTKQRDEFIKKAQALHGELEFCQRMIDLISEKSKDDTVSKEE
jgi:hypothetical protein